MYFLFDVNPSLSISILIEFLTSTKIKMNNKKLISSLGLNEAKKIIPEILTSVVKDQMISDVPVGLFLSGGIDSNLLLSLMTEVSNYKINTYSSFFRVDENDDLKFNTDARVAKKSAEYFKSNHNEISIDEKSIMKGYFRDERHLEITEKINLDIVKNPDLALYGVIQYLFKILNM